MPVMEIGQHTYGKITQQGHGGVRVGKFCSIANGVQAVFLWDHRVDWISTFPFSQKLGMVDIPTAGTRDEKIVVGNDVWLGTSAILMGGAEVGDGAVVGAYSVVAGKIPPYSIAIGNPARIIRKRFSDEEIEALLKIEWWDWTDEKIRENVGLLSTDNIKEFIEKYLPKGGNLCQN